MDPKLRRAGGPRRGVLVAILVLGTMSLAAPRRAEAQFGFGGYGGGLGFGGWHYTAPSVNYINQHSLITAQAAAANRPQNLVAPRDAYEISRDSGLNQRFDIASRRGFDEAAARPRETFRPTPTPAPAPKPVVPLSTFFDKTPRLVWPADAPHDGALVKKREAADKAVLEVLQESNRWGSAPITLANEARTKLIAYGQPALEEIRQGSTIRVADTFHLFLLSLYESIAQATTPAAK